MLIFGRLYFNRCMSGAAPRASKLSTDEQICAEPFMIASTRQGS